MAEIVKMPKLSDTMTEGVVAQWHKKVGETVESGELLAEIETDKATMEFDSFQDGVLLHIGVQEGETAPVDSILAILGEKGEDVAELLKSGSTQTIEEKPEPAVAAPASVPTPVSTQAPKAVSAPVAAVSTAAAPSSNGRVKASPLAKKIAGEKGINLQTVAGSGEGGRVVKRDIENYSGGQTASVASVPAGVESFREENVSQMRKVIAKRLAESKFSAPHFYLTMDIDMDNAIASRKMLKENEIKVSFNDMVIKAVAVSLKKHPKINSSWLGGLEIKSFNHMSGKETHLQYRI